VMMIVLVFISRLKERRARRLEIRTGPSFVPALFPWVRWGTYELRRPRRWRCDRVLVMMMVLVFISRLKERRARRLGIRTGSFVTFALFQRASGGTYELRFRHVLERPRTARHRQHIRGPRAYLGTLWMIPVEGTLDPVSF